VEDIIADLAQTLQTAVEDDPIKRTPHPGSVLVTGFRKMAMAHYALLVRLGLEIDMQKGREKRANVGSPGS
jgi:hypothetical protein